MNLSRRSFLHCSLMAGGLVVVPKFGRWFQPPPKVIWRRGLPPGPEDIYHGVVGTVDIIGFTERGFWLRDATGDFFHPYLT